MAEETNKLKGVVFFYFNLYPDLGQQVAATMQMIKEMNKPLIEKLSEDGRYVCILVPTTKEATRVEKVDYNSPFPRYMPRSLDVQKVGLTQGKNNKANIFQSGFQNEPVFKGLLTLYVNFWPEVKLDPTEVMSIIRTINQEAFDRITRDGQYHFIIVPTTKEATRVEKIDWDNPFPRLVPKTTEKKSRLNVIPPKALLHDMKKGGDDEDDIEDADEIEDEELEGEGKE